jgi:hypothetical protein
MANTATSEIAPVITGEGKNKQTSYISTTVTGGDKNASGEVTYTSAINYSDNAKGTDTKEIATRDKNGTTTFNSSAPDKLTTEEGKKNTEKASNNQIESVKDQVATTSEEKAAVDKATKNKNKAGGDGKEATNNSKASPSSGLFSGSGTKGEGRKSYNKSLCYPTTLRRTQQDTLRISVLKYNPKKMSALGFAKRTSGKTIGAVTLPVPGGVQDGNKTAWGTGTMTPVQIATSDAVKKLLVKDADAAKDSLKKSLQTAAENSGEVKTGLAAMLTENLTGATDILARTEGAVMNPNMELLFRGPAMRAFSFTWKLSPRDERESMTIMRIIRMFKQSMAPKTTKSQLFLKAPNTYKLEFISPAGMRGTHRFLPKVKECAMVDFGVNYTPDGSYMTYDNSSMVSYDMTMSFQELEPIYNSDYSDLDRDRDQSIGY